MDTQGDITLDSDSVISVNWKELMSGIIKDLRESMMVDVKGMVNENMKEFMREITMSLRNDIKETLKDEMNTNKGEIKRNLTPNSQPELITQDTPQQTLRVEELNNLIEAMDIEKNPESTNTI